MHYLKEKTCILNVERIRKRNSFCLSQPLESLHECNGCIAMWKKFWCPLTGKEWMVMISIPIYGAYSGETMEKYKRKSMHISSLIHSRKQKRRHWKWILELICLVFTASMSICRCLGQKHLSLNWIKPEDGADTDWTWAIKQDDYILGAPGHLWIAPP